MARETWYVLEDGNVVDPAECSDVNGALTHESGVKVAMRLPDCPMSRGVDVDDRERKDMKPARTKPGYKTRGAKAD